MPTHNEKNRDPKESALLEALRQNWENARYHESARWKYTYVYYAAFGLIMLYLLKQESLSNLLGNPQIIASLAVLFFLLFLGGKASFSHLLHANMEYKNYIRAIEFMASDLELNIGITEYRKKIEEAKKGGIEEIRKEAGNIARTAYMGLPLLLKVRSGVMTFKNLTSIGISISAALSSFYFLLFLSSLCSKKSEEFLTHYFIDLDYRVD